MCMQLIAPHLDEPSVIEADLRLREADHTLLVGRHRFVRGKLLAERLEYKRQCDVVIVDAVAGLVASIRGVPAARASKQRGKGGGERRRV